MYEAVVCKDGFTVSIQASDTSYSSPRMNGAERYSAVELGFPSQSDDLILEYAEDQHNPTDTVYGWVPVETVNLLIAKHGGVVSGDAPPGVILLSAV
tara:strand:+ start:569 stop:859 length:291 start_codon:yes stop_codon:yes gene_type:complete